eukprot:1160760-Pelagomonas_calceolata.AAC.6
MALLQHSRNVCWKKKVEAAPCVSHCNDTRWMTEHASDRRNKPGKQATGKPSMQSLACNGFHALPRIIWHAHTRAGAACSPSHLHLYKVAFQFVSGA